jgi:hypothetical protein
MKTIEQLLQLSKNPYYKFLPEEKEVLDDFLLKGTAPVSTTSQKTNLNKSSKKTRAIVRNIVKKAATYPPEADESSQDQS